MSGIISTELNDEDIRNIQSAHMFNTVYTKITRSEQNAMLVPIEMVNPYIKYPFSDLQIEKINKISGGRTRLLIMSKEDAEFWSSGNFDCPFRNYRLFTILNKKLIEYPVPKTYKDTAITMIKKFIGQ